MKLKEYKQILKTLNYDKMKPMVRKEVRNKENLRECDYFTTIIGDIVEVVTVYANLDDGTQVSAILPRKILDQRDGTMPQLLQYAKENTQCNFKIGRLFDIVKCQTLHEKQNLTQYTPDYIDTLIDTDNPLHSIIVVNIDTSTRVSILQFPELLRHVYDKIGNYYIVPSSVYEVFIIPQSKIPDIDHMNEIIQHVNKTTVAPNDVLGNKLLKYDNSGLSEC